MKAFRREKRTHGHHAVSRIGQELADLVAVLELRCGAGPRQSVCTADLALRKARPAAPPRHGQSWISAPRIARGSPRGARKPHERTKLVPLPSSSTPSLCPRRILRNIEAGRITYESRR